MKIPQNALAPKSWQNGSVGSNTYSKLLQRSTNIVLVSCFQPYTLVCIFTQKFGIVYASALQAFERMSRVISQNNEQSFLT